MAVDISEIQRIRTTYQNSLKAMAGKNVLGFHVEDHPLLWNLVALAAHRGETVPVADLVLGNLSASHTFRVRNTVFVGMQEYPESFGSEEMIRWNVCQTPANLSDPAELSDYLDQRIGTPVTYTLVTALILRSLGHAGALSLEYTDADGVIGDAWVRITGTGEVIDLAARATGRVSGSRGVNANIVKVMSF